MILAAADRVCDAPSMPKDDSRPPEPSDSADLPDGWQVPDPAREQTKVATVKAAKVGRVPGARRRQ